MERFPGTEPRDGVSDPSTDTAVVGWRSWSLAGQDGPLLQSPETDAVWPAQQPLASESGAGVHAVRDVRDAIRGGGTVLGCVALWGEIVEERGGWRAAEGYPCLLIVGPEVVANDRERLAARYGVPVYGAEIALPDLALIIRSCGRGRALLALRAEAVRASLAGTPPGAQPRDARSTTPIEPLRAVVRAQRVAWLWATGSALMGLCVLPDLWTSGFYGWLQVVPDTGFGRVVFTYAFALTVVFVLHRAKREARVLRQKLRASLGAVGLGLWSAMIVPGVLACTAQVIAAWELCAHHNPAWVPVLLAAPALVAVLGLMAQLAGRSAHPATRSWTLITAVVAVVLIMTCAFAARATPAQLGGDLAFINQDRNFWSARIADNGAPGLCLESPEGFFSGRARATVECSHPHWGEIAGYAPLGPSPYPGDEQASALAAFACTRLETSLGLAGSDLEESPLYPPAATWDDGGRTTDTYATCAVHRSDGAPMPSGQRVDPARRDPDQPATMDLYADRPGLSAPTGTCVATREGIERDIHDAQIVTCDRPHWAEILGYPSIAPPGAPWPGDTTAAAAAFDACQRLAAPRSLPAGVTVSAEWPGQAFWTQMTPRGAIAGCLAHRRDDTPVTGTAW